jgi:hypothetical protein
MYEQFKFWHKDNYNNGQKIPLKELRNNIEGFPNLRVDGNNVLGIKAKTTLEGDNEKD